MPLTKLLQVFLVLFLFHNYLLGQNLPAPNNIQISSPTCGTINLTWIQPGSTDAAYTFFIQKSIDNGLNFFTDKIVTGNTFCDIDVNDASIEYFFKIIAVKYNPYIQSLPSESVSIKTSCYRPTNFNYSPNTCGKTLFSWDASTQINSENYQIFRATDINGPYQNITYSQPTGNQYLHFQNEGKFYFKLRGRLNFDIPKFVYSDFTDPIEVNFECPNVPPIITASNSFCKLFTFNIAPYADETLKPNIDLYMSESESGIYTLVQKYFAENSPITSIVYANGNLLPNKNYFFKIKAIFPQSTTEFGNFVSNSFTCNQSLNLRASNITCNSLKLLWDQIDFGINTTNIMVNVYGKSFEFGGFQYLGNTKLINGNFQVNGIGTINDYYLEVIFPSNSNINLLKSEEVTVLRNCYVPTGLAITNSNCTNLLTWPQVPQDRGITHINVYHRSNLVSEWELVGSTDASQVSYSYTSNFTGEHYHEFAINTVENNSLSDLSQPIVSDLSLKYETIKSGDWYDNMVWDCGKIPFKLDHVKINEGHIISVNNKNILKVKGLENLGQINLLSNSTLKVQPQIVANEIYDGCCGFNPVNFQRGESKIFVPNVFTPNGDGINDFFVPSINGEIVNLFGYEITTLDNQPLFYRPFFDFNNIESYAWNGNSYYPNGTFKEIYTGPFKYTIGLVNAAGQGGYISGYACVVRCSPEAKDIYKNGTCAFPNQGVNGQWNSTILTNDQCN